MLPDGKDRRLSSIEVTEWKSNRNYVEDILDWP